MLPNLYTKKLLAIAFPLSIQMFFVSAIPLTDAFFLSELGEQELAIAALATSLITPVLFFCIALLNGIKILTSRHHQDKTKVESIIVNGCILSFLLGFCIVTSGWFLAPPLSYLISDNQSIELFIAFFRIYVFSIPFALIFVSVREGKIGVNSVKISTYLSMMAVVINISLNYFFVFTEGYKFISPLNGIAFSTVVSYGIMGSISLIIHLTKTRINIFNSIDLLILKKIYDLGKYQAIKRILNLSSSPLIAIILMMLDKIEISIYFIIIRFISYILYSVVSLGEAVCVLTGQYTSDNKYRDIFYIIKSAIFLSSFSLIVSGIFFLYSYNIGHFFGYPIPETISILYLFLLTICYQLAFSIEACLWGGLRGIGITKTGILTSITSLILIPTCCYYFIFFRNIHGCYAVFFSLIINTLVSSSILFQSLQKAFIEAGYLDFKNNNISAN